jgi:hypothetical protein
MQDSSMLAVPRLYQASSQNMAISKRRLGIKYLEDNLMTVTTVRLVITDMKAVLYIHRHRHLRRTVVLLPQELRPNVQAWRQIHTTHHLGHTHCPKRLRDLAIITLTLQ